MSTYFVTGTGNSLLSAYNAGSATGNFAPLSENLLYVTTGEFGFENADGTITYVNGSGFTYDAAAGKFTAGTVTSIRHFDAAGIYVDDITNFATPLAATALQSALEKTSGGDTTALSTLFFAGDDSLNATYFKGTSGGVSLDGLAGNDIIYGSMRGDTVIGGLGTDRLFGGKGADTIFGGNGNDRIFGGGGSDRIYGDAISTAADTGDDRLTGGAGDDEIDGGRGNDVILGGNGDDLILGGIGGDDRLTGGNGSDTFLFSFSGDGIRPVGGAYGNDVITDFTIGVDCLILSDLLGRPTTFTNDADGNAVIRVDAANSVTLIGINANTVTLDDLFMV